MKLAPNCEVCQAIENVDKSTETVLETKHWLVNLDKNQRFLGKCFVTLKQHKNRLSELGADEQHELFKIINDLEKAINKAFAPTHFNWQCLMNIAARNEQETHVHWHLHPRYKTPVCFNGLVFEDKEYYSANERTENLVNEQTIGLIAKKIREEIK